MVDLRCKDWIYLESFYFCFIIFSIIGLGDFLFFEDGRVEVSEYLMMVVGVILGFFMMFIMFCVFGQVVEEGICLKKVYLFVIMIENVDRGKENLKVSISKELVDID